MNQDHVRNLAQFSNFVYAEKNLCIHIFAVQDHSWMSRADRNTAYLKFIACRTPSYVYPLTGI